MKEIFEFRSEADPVATSWVVARFATGNRLRTLMRHQWANVVLALIAGLWVSQASSQAYVPMKWTRFMQVAGQSEPVPEQWLYDEESRIAHSLVLPAVVPKPVPYKFEASLFGDGPGVLSSHRQRAIAYFDHLCKTEAGEWIVKTVPNVDGFYFARPRGRDKPTSDLMADPYGPEMPWIERVFLLKSEDLMRQGAWFIEPPFSNYLFVEQPRREVSWQSSTSASFVRIFGYSVEPALDPRSLPTTSFKQKTPMQVVGIPNVTARYGYTWRGLKREQDRESGIAGGELLIYDRHTNEVIAARRQFLFSQGSRRTGEKVAWETAMRCPQLPAGLGGAEFTRFVLTVLETPEPSLLRNKK